MKSLCASIAVILVAVGVGASLTARSLAAASPQAPAQSASAPTLMRLDGELKTPSGDPRTGSVLLVISVYAEKQDSTPLWVEQQLVTLDQAGRYTVFAGATQDDGMPKDLFLSGSGRWLGVAVQGEAEQPRIMLVTVPYALKAREADTLAGKTATDFVLTSSLNDTVKSALKAQSTSGSTPGTLVSTMNAIPKFIDAMNNTADSVMWDNGGNIGVGTSMPSNLLHLKAMEPILRFEGGGSVPKTYWMGTESSTGRLEIRDVSASAYRMVIDASGNVGIGKPNPGSLLHLKSVEPVVRFEGGGAVPKTYWFGTESSTGRFEIRDVTASAYRFVILGNGNIGIGVTNPLAKLHVGGDVTVDGNIGAKYQDVAEWVETPEPLDAGTVVIVDPSEPNRVLAASRAYDTRVAGAVSRQPGLVLGERSDSKAMVAQSGRVRIKADAQYGAIKIGDLLVTSPTPGYAMRSRPMRIGNQTLHRPGTLLGKALEALPTGKGEILVLLTLQ
jgi:hypothetical protein